MAKKTLADLPSLRDERVLHVAHQLLFVATIAVVGVLAGLRFSSLLRRRG